MRQGDSSFNDRSGISEAQLRRAEPASTPVSTLASTVDETDSQPQGVRGSPVMIVITLGLALCGGPADLRGGPAAVVVTPGELGHVDAGGCSPDACFRDGAGGDRCGRLGWEQS